MRVLVLDFETYWADDYTLSKMTAESYVRDPRFEIIGVAFAYLGEDPVWYTGDLNYIKSVLHQLPWHDIMVVGHNNSAFDSLILQEVVGCRPAGYGCTLQLARCLHGSKTQDGKNLSNALGALAKMYNLSVEKGDEVIHAKNKRRADFTPTELAAYGEYCRKDVTICAMLWQKLAAQMPKSELLVAHICTKMFAEPRLILDTDLLAAMKVELAERKEELLTKVADIMGVGSAMSPDERMYHTQKLLRSDAKFAEMLQSFDVEPPTKLSPKRRDADGKAMRVFAFAKTDAPMSELLEYEDGEDEDTNLAVQAITAARLGSKSTIAESRVARFHDISLRGPLPVPLDYGKTLTGRLAGGSGSKINMQNMNQIKPITKRTPNGSLIMTPGGWSRLKKRAPDMSQILDEHGRVWSTNDCHVAGLRDTIMAPPGYKLVVCDLSNVELRTAHYLCGQMDTIELLRQGVDLYLSFAEVFFGRPLTKADKKERQHGKVAMLQLQFQAGAESFRKAARIMAGVRLNELEAQATVDVYRAKYTQIKRMWYEGQKAIPKCAAGGGFYLDPHELCYVEHNAIRLPNGMRLQYHNLRRELLTGFDGTEELQWVYDDKTDRKMKKTYGGVFGVQGPTQALARNIVMEMQNDIERKYGTYERRGEGVVLSVHDEVMCMVREDRAEECLDFMLARMHQAPKWAADLPLAAEGAIGSRYSECK